MDEIVVPLTKEKYPGQTPRAGHGRLEGGAGDFFRIITTGPKLGISAAWDIHSPDAIGRIRASSTGVPGETRTQAPPPLA